MNVTDRAKRLAEAMWEPRTVADAWEVAQRFLDEHEIDVTHGIALVLDAELDSDARWIVSSLHRVAEISARGWPGFPRDFYANAQADGDPGEGA